MSPIPREMAAACGRLGAEKTNAIKKEKKTMRDIYSNLINSMSQEQFESFIVAVLKNADSSTVSMFREMREGTDGSKIKIDNTGSVEEDKSLLEKLLS